MEVLTSEARPEWPCLPVPLPTPQSALARAANDVHTLALQTSLILAQSSVMSLKWENDRSKTKHNQSNKCTVESTKLCWVCWHVFIWQLFCLTFCWVLVCYQKWHIITEVAQQSCGRTKFCLFLWRKENGKVCLFFFAKIASLCAAIALTKNRNTHWCVWWQSWHAATRPPLLHAPCQMLQAFWFVWKWRLWASDKAKLNVILERAACKVLWISLLSVQLWNWLLCEWSCVNLAKVNKNHIVSALQTTQLMESATVA